MKARAIVSIVFALVFTSCGEGRAPAPAAGPPPAVAPLPPPAALAPPPAAVMPPVGAPPTTALPPSASMPSAAPRSLTEVPALKEPENPDKVERALPPATYEPGGRRDPFQQLELATPGQPRRGPIVAGARLTGIVRSEGSALALVESGDGIGYVLRQGDTLADGRLIEIGADRVIFSVSARHGYPANRVVLQLSSEK